MYCRPTKVLPAVVHPTKCCVNHNFENIVVPHVYPTHTTTVNHTNYQNQQHFPQSQSVVNEVTSTNVGPVPGPPPRPNVGGFGGYPGSVAGAFSGPGAGLDGYPGSVAGAFSGPGAGLDGYPGSVAGAFSGPGAGQGGYPGSVAGAFSGPGAGKGGFPGPGLGGHHGFGPGGRPPRPGCC
jgi:spore coat protein D